MRAALADDFEYDRLILMWAAMEDKDINKTLPKVAPLADTIVLTKVDYDRSAEPEDLKYALPVELQGRVVCEPSLVSALDRAAELAGDRERAGAFYRQLVDLTAAGPTRRPEVEQAKAYLAK